MYSRYICVIHMFYRCNTPTIPYTCITGLIQWITYLSSMYGDVDTVCCELHMYRNYPEKKTPPDAGKG